MHKGDLPVIVIVGGGIGGLYAAYLLGLDGYPVTVLERSDRWGGRIESVPLPDPSPDSFIAEFGPMRFEPGLQEKLRMVASDLQLEFIPFAPTTAPGCPTEYDLSDIESDFKKTSDLLLWAVLRMFFGKPTRTERPTKELPRGIRELHALKLKLNTELFDGSYEEIQGKLDALRRSGHLEQRAGAPLLKDIGLWNALSTIVTPGALARIRDSGTFYHFIAHNPSAVEWGIFWLRQASDKGTPIETFSRESAPSGVHTLVDRLVARLEALQNVHLHRRQRVVRVEHAKHPGEVALRVEGDSGARGAYTVRADHVILALPQAPLRDLSARFPDDVREHLEAVFPLPLLKAFLVTNRPWWRHHLNAQSHAWLVPTRELHYYTTPNDPDCPRGKTIRLGHPGADERCTCQQEVSLGMVMLYTDVPAIDYWRPFIAGADQADADIYGSNGQENPELKRALVRQLLVEAHPEITVKIELARRRVEADLRTAFGNQAVQWIADAHGKQLAGVLRQEFQGASPKRRQLLEEALGKLFGEDGEWVEALLRPPGARKSRDKDRLTDEYLKTVLAYGIHDWSREPFGGAAHVWRPKADSVAVRDRLVAFGLKGRDGQREARNVHICGEAFSDFQGFIEGALSSADRVARAIGGPSLGMDLPPDLGATQTPTR